MAKHWKYSNASYHQCGLMICTACNGHISEGQFRYHTTEEAHLPQHRACSSDDPNWAKLDAEAAAQERFEQRKRAAFAAFVAEFGTPDDLIDGD